MKKRFVTSLVGVVIVTASLAAYHRSNANGEASQYSTSAVARGHIIDTVEATGTLQAVTTVQVGSQVSGTIQSLHADFNSQVRKATSSPGSTRRLLQAQRDLAAAETNELRARLDHQTALADFERAQTAP
jgi:HlyD family secretion protein